ncbi:class I SAM-dependent methyltransferase [Flexivirga endophytica]|jgi:Methylase involved in ubiquinone/menaquinone biosynthesis|uniref:class I SAM-dependent methyltransferase n=1 Tax=Flexivirga endophytica TaxID=1849103 RepID=UPI00166DB19B
MTGLSPHVIRLLPPQCDRTEELPCHRQGWPRAVPSLAAHLAAGTGKLTRPLVPRFARVIAFEPDDGMRRVLAAACAETEALDGSAEHLPVAVDSIDAVIVTQAFHWFGHRHV